MPDVLGYIGDVDRPTEAGRVNRSEATLRNRAVNLDAATYLALKLRIIIEACLREQRQRAVAADPFALAAEPWDRHPDRQRRLAATLRAENRIRQLAVLP
jgi:hypothetical protein